MRGPVETDPGPVHDDAAIAAALRAQGLAPGAADMAFALPAIRQVMQMAREIHGKLARDPAADPP